MLRNVFLPLAAALVSAAATAEARDWTEIEQSGELRVIVAGDEQPEMFNPRETGEPGFERELMEGFVRLHRLRLRPVVVPRYADRIPALQEGRGDAVMGILKTPAREELVDFTPETFPTRTVVVSHKPVPVIASGEEFRRQSIGLLQGTTTWRNAALEAGAVEDEIELFPSLEAVIGALKSRRIGATIMSLSDLGLARRKHPDLQGGLLVGQPRSAAWGVTKGNSSLLRELSTYVTSVRKTQTWSRLVVKYFGPEALLALGRR